MHPLGPLVKQLSICLIHVPDDVRVNPDMQPIQICWAKLKDRQLNGFLMQKFTLLR